MATRIREKTEKIRQTKDTRPFAIVKNVRMSPSKVRIELDNIRGVKALDAVALMENSKQIASEPILKLLKSAIANAENNKGMSADTLVVAECFANCGPTMKRINIRARGRADRLLKRTSHIKIVLDEAK